MCSTANFKISLSKNVPFTCTFLLLTTDQGYDGECSKNDRGTEKEPSCDERSLGTERNAQNSPFSCGSVGARDAEKRGKGEEDPRSPGPDQEEALFGSHDPRRVRASGEADSAHPR